MALVVGFTLVVWQWREVVAARQIALANEETARTDLAAALGTIDTFCTRVSEEELLDQPGMQPLRRQLLGLARDHDQTFQRQLGANPRLMKEFARTFLRSGIITNELGDATAAQVALLRARDILEELCREHPADRSLRLELVRCYNEIHEADRLNYYHAMDLDDFQLKKNHPVRVMEQLVAEEPENPEYLLVLGRSYHMEAIRASRRLDGFDRGLMFT